MKLQRNILEKIIIDEKEVTKNLFQKRIEFQERINKCKQKQQQLLLKQEHVNLNFLKFNKKKIKF